MRQEELVQVHTRTIRVIRSCRTIAQLYAAQKYAFLFVKLVPVINSVDITRELKRHLIRQRDLIKARKIMND